MLEEIILPTTITVHLGRPTASAQNVTHWLCRLYQECRIQ